MCLAQICEIRVGTINLSKYLSTSQTTFCLGPHIVANEVQLGWKTLQSNLVSLTRICVNQ